MKGSKVCKLDCSIDLCITASKSVNRNVCSCYPQLRAVRTLHSCQAEDPGMAAVRSRARSRCLSEAALPSQVTAVAQEELPEAPPLITQGESTATRGGHRRKGKEPGGT